MASPTILLLLCLLGSATAAAAALNVPPEPAFIGWLGERSSSTLPKGQLGSEGGARVSGMLVLSWEPRIFLFRGILTPDECDRIIAKATPRLTRSGVADAVTGKQKIDKARTSSGMFFRRNETRLISSVEARLAKWTMLPIQNGEGMQVLHYEGGQEYRPHHDYFSHERADDNGGNRMATVLMYLSDVEEGGETVFPLVPSPEGQTKAAGFSECAMQGLAYKPRKGDAVAFWSIKPNGRFDIKSLHGSCPVLKGDKWSATKWIHVGELGTGKVERVQYVPPPPPDVPGCINRNDMCQYWADSEECESNAKYMVGSKAAPGGCLKACCRCDLGPNDGVGQH